MVAIVEFGTGVRPVRTIGGRLFERAGVPVEDGCMIMIAQQQMQFIHNQTLRQPPLTTFWLL